MKLCNLTTKRILVRNQDMTESLIPPSGIELRCEYSRQRNGKVAGVDVYQPVNGELQIVENGEVSPAFGPGATFEFDPDTIYVVTKRFIEPLMNHKGAAQFAVALGPKYDRRTLGNSRGLLML